MYIRMHEDKFVTWLKSEHFINTYTYMHAMHLLKECRFSLSASLEGSSLLFLPEMAAVKI